MAETNEQTRKIPLSLYLLDAGIIFPSIIYTVVMTTAIGMIGNPLDPLSQAIRQMAAVFFSPVIIIYLVVLAGIVIASTLVIYRRIASYDGS
ncbi:MAG: hypothetical protein J6W60_01190, partial [Treponema sp.]|nr:hypothetical protein [Treponema sp.]